MAVATGINPPPIRTKMLDVNGDLTWPWQRWFTDQRLSVVSGSGKAGPQGVTGFQGMKGSDGAQGIQGVTGPAGTGTMSAVDSYAYAWFMR